MRLGIPAFSNNDAVGSANKSEIHEIHSLNGEIHKGHCLTREIRGIHEIHRKAHQS